MLFKKNKLQRDVKELEEFDVLWRKFEQIRQSTLSKNAISPEEEEVFTDTTYLLAKRFELFPGSVKETLRQRSFDKIMDNMLMLDKISSLSEDQIKRFEEEWQAAGIILNNILNIHQLKIRSLSKTNPVVGFAKRIFFNPITLIAVVTMTFIAYYIVRYIILK